MIKTDDKKCAVYGKDNLSLSREAFEAWTKLAKVWRYFARLTRIIVLLFNMHIDDKVQFTEFITLQKVTFSFPTHEIAHLG